MNSARAHIRYRKRRVECELLLNAEIPLKHTGLMDVVIQSVQPITGSAKDQRQHHRGSGSRRNLNGALRRKRRRPLGLVIENKADVADVVILSEGRTHRWLSMPKYIPRKTY